MLRPPGVWWSGRTQQPATAFFPHRKEQEMTEWKGVSESGMPPSALNEGYPEKEVLAAARSMGDDTTHYMESTSRLKAENEELRERAADADADWRACYDALKAAEATMREVAEELRRWEFMAEHQLLPLADRLSPPPVVEKPPA